MVHSHELPESYWTRLKLQAPECGLDYQSVPDLNTAAISV